MLLKLLLLSTKVLIIHIVLIEEDSLLHSSRQFTKDHEEGEEDDE